MWSVLCKVPDISTSLRLSTFEHHLLLLPVADSEEGRAGSAPPWATDRRRHCRPTADKWQRYCIMATPSPVISR